MPRSPVSPRPAATRRRRWAGLASVALAGAAALAGCNTLDEQQRKWIFQPSTATWSAGLAAAQGMNEVWIELPAPAAEPAPAPRLHGLWLPQDRPDAPVLLYLHGARWDVRGSAPRMRRLHELGFSVLGIDYRGFGQSSALLPSEESADEDARAAWRWLAQAHPQSRRFVFGHSLGAAIAVRLASEADDVGGLIVEGAFPSMSELVGSFKWGWLPVGPLITQRFEAGQRIGQVRAPVLVVHGSADRLIAPALGQALYERVRSRKRFVLVEGGSHHNTNAVGQTQVRDAVQDLFGL